jgi:hypothetical protein
MADFRQRHKKAKTDVVAGSKLEQTLSNEEVAEWLQMFESAAPKVPPGSDSAAEKPQNKPVPTRRAKSADKSADKAANRPAVDAAEIKSGTRKLDDDEVSKWLEIFGNGDDQTP